MNIDFPVDDDITKQIDSFVELPMGWDYGKGIPVSQKAAINAKSVYLIAKTNGFGAEPHPTPNGGITMILFFKDHFLDIEIVDSINTYSSRYEIGTGDDFKIVWKNQNVNVSMIPQILLQIKSITA